MERQCCSQSCRLQLAHHPPPPAGGVSSAAAAGRAAQLAMPAAAEQAHCPSQQRTAAAAPPMPLPCLRRSTKHGLLNVYQDRRRTGETCLSSSLGSCKPCCCSKMWASWRSIWLAPYRMQQQPAPAQLPQAARQAPGRATASRHGGSRRCGSQHLRCLGPAAVAACAAAMAAAIATALQPLRCLKQ